MRSKSLTVTKKTAFEICKKALKEFECEIVNSDFSEGIIEAKKKGNLFSFGHRIYVSIKIIDYDKVNLSVSSNSVGIQLIDWGTNSENEDELMKTIANLLK